MTYVHRIIESPLPSEAKGGMILRSGSRDDVTVILGGLYEKKHTYHHDRRAFP